MADYKYASLAIPNCYLDEDVKELIIVDFGYRDWEGVPVVTQNFTYGEGVTVVQGEEIENGRFTVLEEKLMKRNIPFDRLTSHCYEEHCQKFVYRPGYEPKEYSVNEFYDQVIQVSSVQNILQEIVDGCSSIEAIKMLTNTLFEEAGTNVPSLESYAERRVNN